MIVSENNKSEIILFAILCLCIILGFYFRIKGLSYGGFSSSDEYYMAKSIHHILKFGVPKFPLGGYYERGLIYQYLSAFLLIIGVKEVFALRIIPLIFNMLAIPAIFFIGKKIGGKLIAYSVLVLFCFSVWEIEYARLARYYAPFQTMFIWYIYFLYKRIIENNHKSFKWMLILSFTCVFMYEGSIFMVLLNFVPFIILKEKVNIKNLSYTIIIFLSAFMFLKIDFRNMGVTNYLPPDIIFPAGKGLSLPIDVPDLFITTFTSIWFVLFIAPLSIFIFYCSFIIRNRVNIRREMSIILIILAFLSLFNLFGIILITILIMFLVNWIKFEDLKKKSFYLLIGIVSFNFIFYLIYGLISKSWLIFFPEESHISINKIFWVFFNYPNFYQKIFLPWLYGMPLLTILSFIFIGASLLIVFYRSWKRMGEGKSVLTGGEFLLAVLIFLVSLVAALKMPYNSTRYTFFIYPLVLLLILYSTMQICNFLFRDRKYILLFYYLLAAGFVLLSADYSIYHLINIDSKEVHFRTIYNHKRATIYFYRNDYVTPAEVINENMNDSDLVVTTQAPIEYYLKRLDYYYRNYKDAEFTGRSRLDGKKEIWTNANLIYTKKDFLNFLQSSKRTIWLSNFSSERFGESPLEVELNKKYSKYLYFVNLDSSINVYKIPPSENNHF